MKRRLTPFVSAFCRPITVMGLLLVSLALLLAVSAAPTQSTTIRFAVIGSYGSADVHEGDVANLVKSWNPDFIITTGDNNLPDGAAATIDPAIGQYYHDFIFPYHGAYGSGAAANRFFPALGSHDWDLTVTVQPYLDYFTLPSNERYYDFVQGPVHFFAIDSDVREPDGITANSVQALWLKSQLAASTSRWNVVYFHHSPYSSLTSWTKLQWPFQQWGATAVLAGKSNVYERVMVNGFPYFTNGLGGKGTGTFTSALPESVARFGDDYGAQLVTASQDSITFQFFTRAGLLIDTFTLDASPSPSPSPSPSRFAVIGSYGSADVHETYVANLVKSWNPDLIITTGNNNLPDGAAATIDPAIGQYYHDFIYPYHGAYGSGAVANRFFPALGSHDWDLVTGTVQPYLDYFALPSNERYYDFVQGPVHFFAIDSDAREPDGITANSVQALWLKSQLAASTSRWNIVYFHHPPFSSLTSWTKLQWPFQQWGATAVLAGKSNVYERVMVNGFPYFTNGLGGKSTGAFVTALPESVVRFGDDYGAQLVTATQNSITFQFFTVAGVLIDTFTLEVPPSPSPSVATILPTSKIAGDTAFVLTVNGTGFNNSSVVQFNGNARTTTFVSPTQLTAELIAADAATAGTFSITVFNPAPGGGTSSAVNLTVNNPLPTVSTLSPASRQVGDAAFALTVNGTNFNSSSIVRFNGDDRTTTLVNSLQLTAQLTTADLATAGTFPITVFNPAPGGGISISAVSFTVNNPIPSISTISPANKTAGDAEFVLTVNGSNLISGSVVRWNGVERPTTFVSGAQLTAQIGAADVAAAGTSAITVFNPTPGGGLSNGVNLTVRNPSILSVVSGSGAANSKVTVPIEISAQGDETAVAFSLTYDTTLLVNSLNPPQVTLGSDAAAATLNTDSTQVAQGLLGITLTLPAGQSLAAGIRQLVTVTFTTANVVTQTTTAVGFADQPVVRAVSNSLGQALPAAYSPGTATITVGYEADVAPRPNGSNTGTIAISDWVQVGRFASGLDTPDVGSEFQRADCAPRSTLGNGSITISDWVQAGRYASGLDPATAAGGPTEPPTGAAPAVSQMETDSLTTQAANGVETVIAEATTVNLVSTILPAGQSSSVSIEFEAQGNENAFGFSLMFDPAKLSFVSAEKSNEASGATLNVNKLEAAEGRVGLALALPGGSTFAGGRHQLVVLTFALRADASELPLISFTDQPIAREVVDLSANRLKAVFKDGSEANPLEDAPFFVTQHYLDFLNRTQTVEDLLTGPRRSRSVVPIPPVSVRGR